MTVRQPPLRVVFAEDNYLVREGTAALLAEVDEVELVRLVERSDSLIEGRGRTVARCGAHRHPDAAHATPPRASSRPSASAASIPGTGVVVLSQYVEPDYAFELLAEGVAGLGYLLKERVSQVDELVRALQEVCRGGSVLDPKVVEGLARAQIGRGRASPLAGLTERELEVLQQMATGRSNAAIAGSST